MPAAANVPALKTQTSFGYFPNNRLITTTSDRDGFGDDKLKSEIVYDGLGRTTEQRTYEATSAYIKVETLYDGLGRVSQVSNPYRTGSPVWTTTAYDALGRVTTVTSPGNAVVTTEYSGTRVKVRDQANKERVSETDAFGRLSKVWEVRTSEPPYTVSFNFPQNGGPLYYGYLTQYSYDLLDNLTSVAQGVRWIERHRLRKSTVRHSNWTHCALFLAPDGVRCCEGKLLTWRSATAFDKGQSQTKNCKADQTAQEQAGRNFCNRAAQPAEQQNHEMRAATSRERQPERAA